MSHQLVEAEIPSYDRFDLAVGVGLACFAALIYLPSLNVGFFSDDLYFIGRNAPVMERPLFIFHIFYRDFIPVVHASFALDWLLARDWAPFYHCTSIFFHAITTALVFLLCRGFGAPRWLGATATLLWAVNVHISETVIWTAARGHSLATLFLVAAFVALRSRARLWAAVLPWILALGAKETALFPVVLAPLARRGDPRARLRAALVFAPLAVGFAVFNLVAKPQLHLARGTPVDFILQGPFTLLRPIGLARWYDFSAVHAAAVYLIFAVLLVVLRKSPAGVIGLGWVLTSMVPVSVQPVYTSRYFYMITVGYALLVCALVPAIAKAVTSRTARRMALAGGAVLWSLIVTANVALVQREIADYRLLAAPTMACMEALRSHVRELAPGETLVVLDAGPRSTIARLNSRIEERGHLSKLIPFRKRGVDGLVDLTDVVNFEHPRQRGFLAHTSDPAVADVYRWVLWDGTGAHALAEAPDHRLSPERVLASTWGDADAFFENRFGSPEY